MNSKRGNGCYKNFYKTNILLTNVFRDKYYKVKKSPSLIGVENDIYNIMQDALINILLSLKWKYLLLYYQSRLVTNLITKKLLANFFQLGVRLKMTYSGNTSKVVVLNSSQLHFLLLLRAGVIIEGLLRSQFLLVKEVVSSAGSLASNWTQLFQKALTKG